MNLKFKSRYKIQRYTNYKKKAITKSNDNGKNVRKYHKI